MKQEIEIPSDAAMHGIKNLLDDYIGITPNDSIVICFWHECRDIVTWVLYELEERNQKFKIFPYGHRDESKFSYDLNKLIDGIKAQNTNSRIILLICEDEVLSFSSYLKSLLPKSIVVWRIMNTSAHLFEQAFAYRTKDLKNINAWLLSKLMTSEKQELRIENNYGTSLNVVINNNKFKWISTFGVQKKNEILILPTGEINTFPEYISGTFVAFGAIHANIKLPFDTRLQHNPIQLEFRNGTLHSFTCKNQQLNGFLELIFKEKHLTSIGEFGIGTNIGITKFVENNSHINERFPGVHLGLGMHLQAKSDVRYKTPIHIDFISPYGRIYYNKEHEPIALDQLARVAHIETSHPANLSAEDGG